MEEQATKVHLRSLDCQDVDTSRLEGSDSSEACRVCLPRCLPRRHAEEGWSADHDTKLGLLLILGVAKNSSVYLLSVIGS